MSMRRKKNAILLMLPIEEISLQPELSRGGGLSVTDGRKEHGNPFV